MASLRVGVLGYGVIGRRLADAVRLQPDMQLVGVAGRPGSYSLRDAHWAGHPIYLTEPARDGDVAERLPVGCGRLDDLLSAIDVLLDCTPAGVPRGYRAVLDGHPRLVTIVQGGEGRQDCEVSFNSMTNFPQAFGKKRIRVISCSSTGITRFLHAIDRTFGVHQAFVTLARRAADPGKVGKVPFNALVPTMGLSHHGRDVQTVFPGLDVVSISVDCPTTLGHVIRFLVDLRRSAAVSEVVTALRKVPRVIVGRGLATTAELAESFNDLGRHRYDRPEIYLFEESLEVHGMALLAAISVHMESITIPETIDCIRACLGRAGDPGESIAMTDHALGIGRKESDHAVGKGTLS